MLVTSLTAGVSFKAWDKSSLNDKPAGEPLPGVVASGPAPRGRWTSVMLHLEEFGCHMVVNRAKARSLPLQGQPTPQGHRAGNGVEQGVFTASAATILWSVCQMKQTLSGKGMEAMECHPNQERQVCRGVWEKRRQARRPPGVESPRGSRQCERSWDEMVRFLCLHSFARGRWSSIFSLQGMGFLCAYGTYLVGTVRRYRTP